MSSVGHIAGGTDEVIDLVAQPTGDLLAHGGFARQASAKLSKGALAESQPHESPGRWFMLM